MTTFLVGFGAGILVGCVSELFVLAWLKSSGYLIDESDWEDIDVEEDHT